MTFRYSFCCSFYSYFKSNETKVIDKIQSCCEFLKILVKECISFEMTFKPPHYVYVKYPPSNVYTPNVSERHNLEAFFLHTLFSIENEYIFVERTIRQIEMISRAWDVPIYSGLNFEATSALLNDYLEAVRDLKAINSSGMLRRSLSEFISKDNLELISNAIVNMSYVIRNTHVYVWSTKNIILKYSMKMMESNSKCQRNIFIGS